MEHKRTTAFAVCGIVMFCLFGGTTSATACATLAICSVIALICGITEKEK